MLGWGTKEPFSGIQVSWFEPELQFKVTLYRRELEVRSAVFGSLKSPQLLGELIPHQQTAAPSEDLLQAKLNVGFSATQGGQRQPEEEHGSGGTRHHDGTPEADD